MSRPSDKELLRRAIVNVKAPMNEINYPRWAAVRDLLLVGSTTAKDLCCEAGTDPDEYLTGDICEVCSEAEECDEASF